MSTNFEPKTEKERRKRNGDDAHVKKPACLDMYNDNIGGVNRSDKLHLSTPLLNPPKSGTSICFGLFFSSLLLISLKFSKKMSSGGEGGKQLYWIFALDWQSSSLLDFAAEQTTKSTQWKQPLWRLTLLLRTLRGILLAKGKEMQKWGTVYNARKTVEQPQVIEQKKQSMSLRNVALHCAKILVSVCFTLCR